MSIGQGETNNTIAALIYASVEPPFESIDKFVLPHLYKAHYYEVVWHGCLLLHSVSGLVHIICPRFNSRPTLFLEPKSY